LLMVPFEAMAKRSERTSEAAKAQQEPQRAWSRIGWQNPGQRSYELKVSGTSLSGMFECTLTGTAGIASPWVGAVSLWVQVLERERREGV